MHSTIYSYLDKPVQVIEANQEIWFMAKDIFDLLDLSWRGADSLWQRQIPKIDTFSCDILTKGGKQNAWFVNKAAVELLIKKSSKQSDSLVKLSQEMGININYTILRNENELLNILQSILYGFGAYQIDRQYKIGIYKVDGYIKQLNIIIEYDELYHHYNEVIDKKRIDNIIRELPTNSSYQPIIFRIKQYKELEAISEFVNLIRTRI